MYFPVSKTTIFFKKMYFTAKLWGFCAGAGLVLKKQTKKNNKIK